MAKGIDSSGEGAVSRSVERLRSRVSGLDRTLQVVDYLSRTGEPAGIYKIAKAVRIPLSTAYPLIDELVRRNLLTRDGNMVWLGSRLLGYGLVFASSLDFLDFAVENMRSLSAKIEAIAMVCARERDEALVLAAVEPEVVSQSVVHVGMRLPLNWLASGALLVGHLPFAERFRIFDRSAKLSPNGRAEIEAAKLAEEAPVRLESGLAVEIGARRTVRR